jgi:hypothetical protein
MASSVYAMSQVVLFLDKLGMSKYTYRFLHEGFDTFETLLEVWESDL